MKKEEERVEIKNKLAGKTGKSRLKFSLHAKEYRGKVDTDSLREIYFINETS